MPKILVWTGTHPDEKRAVKVGDSLRDTPIPNVATDVANPEALRLSARFVNMNLMEALHCPDARSEVYEAKRAVEVHKKSREFKGIIIDLHDVAGFGSTSAVIDKRHGVTPQILGFLAFIGAENLVLSEGMGLHKYYPNSFLIEMGQELDSSRLREGLYLLANDAPRLQPRTPADFRWFEWLDGLFVSKHGHPKDLGADFDRLRPFEEFPGGLVIDGKRAYLMSWSPRPNRQDCWGELVTPVSRPDNRDWPIS